MGWLNIFQSREKRWKDTAAKAREGKGIAGLLNKIKPLRGFMRMILSQNGVATEKSISTFDLLLLFASKILRGRAQNEAKEIIAIVGERRNFETSNPYTDVLFGEAAPAVLAAIASIITALSSFFKGMKEARDRGELDEAQAKAVDSAEDAINAASGGLGTAEVGYQNRLIPGALFSGANILIPVGIGVAVYLLTKKK